MPRPTLATAAAALTLMLVAGFAPAHAVTKDGGPGDDKLTGTAQRDVLRGKQGDDRLFGFAGNDRLVGGIGDDQLKGGAGADNLVGQSGNDRISTGFDAVDDIVSAGSGDDVVYMTGGDEVFAVAGDDKINATYPEDDMYIDCGTGEDEVVFNEEPSDEVYVIDCEKVSVQSAG